MVPVTSPSRTCWQARGRLSAERPSCMEMCDRVTLYVGLYHYRPQWSWGKVIFSEACVKNSVHRGVLSRPTPRGMLGGSVWGVSRPTPRGEVGRSGRGVQTQGYNGGSGWGYPGSHLGGQDHTWGSRPTPGAQVHTRGYPGPHLGGSGPDPGGCIPACTEANPPRQLLLWAVRILLECILVSYCNGTFIIWKVNGLPESTPILKVK